MKIKDIIREDIDPAVEQASGLEQDRIQSHTKGPIKNVTTFPDQNMSTGSAYMNYRFGIALAGAPDFPAAAEPYIGGDPMVVPYTQADMDMVNSAAEFVGDHSKRIHSSSKSEEIEGTYKKSPVSKPKKNRYGV